jgi:NAD(P)-dependent dehydrogenase (short-subunit alcohol dehydrogenase family)
MALARMLALVTGSYRGIGAGTALCRWVNVRQTWL